MSDRYRQKRKHQAQLLERRMGRCRRENQACNLKPSSKYWCPYYGRHVDGILLTLNSPAGNLMIDRASYAEKSARVDWSSVYGPLATTVNSAP
jgi:hypothetical protein